MHFKNELFGLARVRISEVPISEDLLYNISGQTGKQEVHAISAHIARQHLVELETFFIEYGMYEQGKWASTNLEITQENE